MTDDEQREAVARALYESWRTPGDSAAWDGLYADELRAPWLRSADAALSALAPVQPDEVLCPRCRGVGGHVSVWNGETAGRMRCPNDQPRAVQTDPTCVTPGCGRPATDEARDYTDDDGGHRVVPVCSVHKRGGDAVQPDPLRAGVEALADEWADAFVTGRAAAVPLWERIEQLRALLAETEVPRG